MTRLSLPHGQLCVWTDIDPAHEADFNAWYDREHMQERVAIPGFTHARRFRATDGGPRRYLALYVTDTLDVFRGDAYRRAFTQQTAWSLANFARMTGTQRRVGELTIEAGDGEGAHLALFVLPPDRIDVPHLRARFDAALQEPGIHAARLFRTSPDLSAPIGRIGGQPGRRCARAGRRQRRSGHAPRSRHARRARRRAYLRSAVARRRTAAGCASRRPGGGRTGRRRRPRPACL
ncbi:conserved hypothetical protein, partial [Burkholderia cenocepacia PC184]